MVTLNDIDLLVKDTVSAENGNYSQAERYRHIARAIDYWQRKLGLPANKDIYTFNYFQDQNYYSLPADYSDADLLTYHNLQNNKVQNEWQYRTYDEVLRRMGEVSYGNNWGIVSYNGAWQLLLTGGNTRAGTEIDNLDNTNGWTVSGDASGLTTDSLIKQAGSASLSFDITNSTGLSTLTRTGLSLSVKELFENSGAIKMYAYLPTANFDGVSIQLVKSSGNYYTITETTWEDGTAFSTLDWKKIAWNMDDAVSTGTIAHTDTITEIKIIFDQGSGFTSAVDVRIDSLYSVIPDKLDLIYWTNYRVRTDAGVLTRDLVNPTDEVVMCDLIPDLDEGIALRASVMLMPSLRADKDFMQSYRGFMQENLYDYGRRYPRKKLRNHGTTRLSRRH